MSTTTKTNVLNFFFGWQEIQDRLEDKGLRASIVDGESFFVYQIGDPPSVPLTIHSGIKSLADVSRIVTDEYGA